MESYQHNNGPFQYHNGFLKGSADNYKILASKLLFEESNKKEAWLVKYFQIVSSDLTLLT